MFRLVRELSPVISKAAAGFHTSRLGGRAMGGVRRRDAVVVARRSQPALENTPAWIHVSTVLGLGASWRGNALVRSRCLVCYSPLAQLFNLRLEPVCPLLLAKGRSHSCVQYPYCQLPSIVRRPRTATSLACGACQ